ncbi:hypothetical protein M8818_006203 [Zalaria obscura]|uniref:Uncharacterized protein n=1 Tax=Zalaria obscura TaxID=2024903 RepID=A0ACC3S7U8_9PEZI
MSCDICKSDYSDDGYDEHYQNRVCKHIIKRIKKEIRRESSYEIRKLPVTDFAQEFTARYNNLHGWRRRRNPNLAVKQNDFLTQKLRDIIEAYVIRDRDFAHFASLSTLGVLPLFKTEAEFPALVYTRRRREKKKKDTLAGAAMKGSIQSTNVKMYAIGCSDEIFRIVPVRMLRSLTSPGADYIVQVRVSRKWVEFQDWLEQTWIPSHINVTGEHGYDVLSQWWKRNGQRFRLLDFPTEIKNMIYGHYFGVSTIYPYKGYKWESATNNDYTFLSIAQGCQYYNCLNKTIAHDPTFPYCQPPQRQLLLTSRAVHADVNRSIWSLPKAFHHLPDLDFFLTSTLPTRALRTARYANLHNLKLQFSHTDYILFFGVPIPPFKRWPRKNMRSDAQNNHSGSIAVVQKRRRCGPPAAVLHQLPALRILELFFRSPIIGCKSDPWARAKKVWGEESTDWCGHRTACTSCQKTLVEWILAFARGFVRHIAEVRLTGFVKDSTRRMWEEGWDWEGEMERISGLPDDAL